VTKDTIRLDSLKSITQQNRKDHAALDKIDEEEVDDEEATSTPAQKSNAIKRTSVLGTKT
jgi:hypothetical protein